MSPATIDIDDAAKRVAKLIEERSKLSFFVGAGVSKLSPSCLPDWAEFRNAMLTALTERLSLGGFLTANESCAVASDLLGYDTRYGSLDGLWLKPEVVLHWIHTYVPNTVRRMFDIFSFGAPNKNHLTLAYLAAYSDTLVATCNFDTHIEHALETAGVALQRFAGTHPANGCRSFRKYIDLTNKPHRDQVCILKIHGCLSAPSTIRATLQQVSRETPPSKRKALHNTVTGRFLVVAGYSGRDTDIRPEIEVAAPDSNGILWLARDENSLIPELNRIPKITIAMGDINEFFNLIALRLGIKDEFGSSFHISTVDYTRRVARHARVFPTALALSELAMHIGCRSTVEILTQKIVESCHESRWVALAWMSLGDSKRRENVTEALACFERAEAVARPLRSRIPLLYGHALKYLAAQHYLLGALDKALFFNTKCLAWVKRAGDRATEGRALDDRALIYRQRGNVRYAITLRKKAIMRLRKAGDLISLAMVYNNLGKDYDTIEDFAEAEIWWRKSLDLKEKETSNSPDLGRTCFNIGELLRHTGKTVEAIPFLRRARARARMHGDHVIEARALYSIAAIAHSHGKPAQAKRLLARGINVASSAQDWFGHQFRVKWAQKIEDVITGKLDARKDKAEPIRIDST